MERIFWLDVMLHIITLGILIKINVFYECDCCMHYSIGMKLILMWIFMAGINCWCIMPLEKDERNTLVQQWQEISDWYECDVCFWNVNIWFVLLSICFDFLCCIYNNCIYIIFGDLWLFASTLNTDTIVCFFCYVVFLLFSVFIECVFHWEKPSQTKSDFNQLYNRIFHRHCLSYNLPYLFLYLITKIETSIHIY